jgi:putative membrane protein
MTAIGGDAFLSLLSLIVLLALLALVAYALYRNWEGGPEKRADDAITALRTRYARGDVDDDEFERRYARLTRESP